MMARDGIPATRTVRCRTPHDIRQRTVLLDEIKIRGRDIPYFMSEIVNDRNRLQKYFGQRHGRTIIKVNAAAIHFPNERTEKFEIRVRSSAGGSSVERWVKVPDVRSDRNVGRERNFAAVRLTDQ